MQVLHTQKSSIFNSLPPPAIHTTPYHSCVTLTLVINYFLAYRHSPAYTTGVDGDNVSQKVEFVLTSKQSLYVQKFNKIQYLVKFQ